MVTPLAQGALLRAARDAPSVPVDALAAGGVLVLAPHPDDETLGCGAALAAAVTAGHAVHVVAATDGDGSHPGSVSWPRARVAARRAGELAAALDVLGGGRVTHERLGCPDQGVPMPDGEAGRALVGRLLARALTDRPAHLWTTWEGDPHVDHRCCAALAEALVARAAAAGHSLALSRFPVWGRFVERGDGSGNGGTRDGGTRDGGSGDALVRFEPGSILKAVKVRALACHATQMTTAIGDDPDGFVMPVPMQTHFVEHDELFLRREAP